MEPNVNSIHFLWAAYILVAVANIGHALWLRSLWVKLHAPRNNHSLNAANGRAQL